MRVSMRDWSRITVLERKRQTPSSRTTSSRYSPLQNRMLLPSSMVRTQMKLVRAAKAPSFDSMSWLSERTWR